MSNYVNLLDIVYPVGSVYITTTENSPADSIGGTWVEIKDRVLLDRTDENCLTQNGNMTHKHVLSANGGALLDFIIESPWVNIMYTYSSRLIFKNPVVKHALQGVSTNVASPAKSDLYPVQLTGYTDETEAYPAYFCVRIYYRTA